MTQRQINDRINIIDVRKGDRLMDKLILIPAYKPDGRLTEICRKL